MKATRTEWRHVRRYVLLIVASVLVSLGHAPQVAGQSLDVPAPRTSTNAAIHYQRAILFLSAIDPARRELLQKPIWEIITPTTSEADLAAVDQLLVESRHAIRSAMVGTQQTDADFGLDIRQYMIASYLPHGQPMTDIGKLIALHGMQRQSTGDWQAAAQIYLGGLRIGRHLARQVTLAEAMAGVDVLETMYFAIGNWAVRCPDAELVSEMLNIVNAMSVDMVNPARTMRFEASITKMRLDAMQEAYPDGPWAEMVLETLGADFPIADQEGMRKAAVDAAAKVGVPREVFDDKESLSRYVQKLQSIYIDLAKQTADCLTFPPPESIRRGSALFAQYESKLLPTERSSGLNPARTAAYFAVHQAELDVLRLVLAISAERTSSGFPPNLESVQERLGTSLPMSPYDGSDFEYEVLEGGKGFSLKLPAAKVGDIELPGIKFEYVDAKLAE